MPASGVKGVISREDRKGALGGGVGRVAGGPGGKSRDKHWVRPGGGSIPGPYVCCKGEFGNFEYHSNNYLIVKSIGNLSFCFPGMLKCCLCFNVISC